MFCHAILKYVNMIFLGSTK